MDLIIDANILFAALIKRSITSHLLFKEGFHLYAPEFIFTEFEKYKRVIKEKTERSEEEIEALFDVLNRRISIVSREEIKPFISKAKEISPDPKDVQYVALALKMNIPIWSNDRPLKEKQSAVEVYTTQEVRNF